MKQDLIRLRRANVRDLDDLMAVQRRSWQQTYQGLIPYVELQAYTVRRNRKWWMRVIAGDGWVEVLEFEGRVIGYLLAGPSRMARLGRFHGTSGEIAEFYLLPVYQGIGFGGRLMRSAENYFRKQAFEGYFVNVLADNEKARRVYEHRGGRLVEGVRAEMLPGGIEVLIYYFPLEE